MNYNMKKRYIALALVSALCACEPVEESGSFGYDQNVSSSNLLEGMVCSQYDLVDGKYVESSTGNYIKYDNQNVPSLRIYYIKPDGSQATLDKGKAGGIFNFVPKRGSEPKQTVYFEYITPAGEVFTASKEFTVKVAADLSMDMKLLCGNAGRKTWVWDDESGACWGSAGYLGFVTSGAASLTDGAWWGVATDGLGEQFEGYNYAFVDGPDSKMVLTDDGEIIKSSGGRGTFSVDMSITDNLGGYAAEGKTMGRLTTTGDGILFNQRINAGDHTDLPAQISEFDIAYVSPEHLVLISPSYFAATGGADWQEGTFWRFKSLDDAEGCLADNAEKTWTWDDTEGFPCWGNVGYVGFATSGKVSITAGAWWGVDPEGIAEQIEGASYAFADAGSVTMTFSADGSMTKSSGGKGTWSYDGTDTAPIGGWSKKGKTQGRLTVSGDGVLFNHRINAGDHEDLPSEITEFDVVFMGEDNLVLAAPSYFEASDGQDWQECTFWRFKKAE